MKICWFNDNRLGLVEDGRVRDVSAALAALPPLTYPGPRGDPLIANLARVREEIAKAAPKAASHPIAGVKFLSPVANPTKIIGVPVNYLKHAEEAEANRAVFSYQRQDGIEAQGLFLKANSALVGPGEGVRVRFPDRRSDHEMELGVVIGRETAKVAEADAMSCIAGYAIALDMVVRGPEDRSFRKSLDTYAVLGPWLVTADEVADPGNLDFSLAVNGELRQASNTRHMIMGLARQIAWASTFYTLWPGDIIMTGTCEGVGQVKPGDVMHCEIEGIGAMDVPVTAG
jgi:2-keto-4-pentenoate hydratase/2-oxohepta-3-ene-1,7-dioic acid hydratase in catechol pathway